MPIVHARDAAQAKIAAIGSVNPRAGGPVNQAIQFVKKTLRGLCSGLSAIRSSSIAKSFRRLEAVDRNAQRA